MREHYQTKKCPRCIGPVQWVDKYARAQYTYSQCSQTKFGNNNYTKV